MDTVEPSSNKKCIIDSDGKIHSDGTTVLGADDLAGISAIIESVRALKESGESHRPIELLFSVSEENYCKGVSHFDFSKIKSREAYVFDLDGEVGTAAYAAPTILSFTANIIGKASHAGFAPEKGIHSIKIACDAITKINCGRLDDDTTVNIGTISGGASTNIVPDSCTITGEIRSYNDDKAVAQYKKIFDIITQSSDEYGAKSEISFTRNVTAYETDIHHSVVDRFVKACDNLNIKSKLIRSFGGSDNNVMAQNSITGIVVATAMNNCHSTSEWTTTDELINATSVALELLRSTK
jgi:tripeptide aminopeptidase